MSDTCFQSFSALELSGGMQLLAPSVDLIGQQGRDFSEIPMDLGHFDVLVDARQWDLQR